MRIVSLSLLTFLSICTVPSTVLILYNVDALRPRNIPPSGVPRGPSRFVDEERDSEQRHLEIRTPPKPKSGASRSSWCLCWASHLCWTLNLHLLSTFASFIDSAGVRRAGTVCPTLGKRQDPVLPRRGCPVAEKAELTGIVGRCLRATMVERGKGIR